MSSRPEEVGYDLARFTADALEDWARILKERLKDLRGGLAPVDIHKARVAARRTREALALAALIDPDLSSKPSKRAREVVRALSHARTFDSLAAVATALGLPAGFDEARSALLAHLSARRESALAAAVEVLSARKVRRLPGRLRRVAEALRALPQPETPDRARFFAVAAELLGPRLRALTAHAALAGSATADDLHEGRIATKKLRYAWELLRPALSPGAYSEIKRHLEEAQELGGQFHDLDLLREETLHLARRRKHKISFDALLGYVEAQCDDRRRRFQQALAALGPDFERRIFAILDPASF